MNAILLALSLTSFAEVQRMGDNSFHVREEASQNLRCLMPYSMPVVRASRHHYDAEVRHRCDFLTTEWDNLAYQNILQWTVSFRCKEWRYTPYIDAIETDTELVTHYLQMAREGELRADIPIGEPYKEYRTATLYYVADLLLAGKSVDEVKLLYSLKCENDKRWLGTRPDVVAQCENK